MQMKFLNIGPLELVFIVLLAIIILGPGETLKTIRTVGQWIYKFVRSPYWQTVLDAQKEIRDLPTKLVRESGLDESLAEIRKETSSLSNGLQTGLSKARQAMKVDEINAASNLSVSSNAPASPDIGSLVKTGPGETENSETDNEE